MFLYIYILFDLERSVRIDNKFLCGIFSDVLK